MVRNTIGIRLEKWINVALENFAKTIRKIIAFVLNIYLIIIN